MFKILSHLYEVIWVPVFGRVLNMFSLIIEGKKPDTKPTYDINKSSTKSKGS